MWFLVGLVEGVVRVRQLKGVGVGEWVGRAGGGNERGRAVTVIAASI